jgi:hypothetical protein
VSDAFRSVPPTFPLTFLNHVWFRFFGQIVRTLDHKPLRFKDAVPLTQARVSPSPSPSCASPPSNSPPLLPPPSHSAPRPALKYKFDVFALQEVFATPWLFGRWCMQKTFLRRMHQLGIDSLLCCAALLTPHSHGRRLCYRLLKGYTYQVKSPNPGVEQLIGQWKWTDSGLLIVSRYPIVRYAHCTFKASPAGGHPLSRVSSFFFPSRSSRLRSPLRCSRH